MFQKEEGGTDHWQDKRTYEKIRDSAIPHCTWIYYRIRLVKRVDPDPVFYRKIRILSAHQPSTMIDFLKACLWRQFGASIDMLINAVQDCPADYWRTNPKFHYMAYHTALYLEYYLSVPPIDFVPLLPYTSTAPEDLPSEAVDDSLPNRHYTQQELLHYLQAGREKCRQFIAGLTEEKLQQCWTTGATGKDLALSDPRALDYPVLDMIFINMRHVQHHTAQMNLLLRQTINAAPDWIATVETTE